MAPASAVQVDLADLSAAVEAASCDVVIERIGRARQEQREREEPSRLASEALEEKARQEREAEIARELARREALS